LGTETKQFPWFCLSHHIQYCQKPWIVCLSHHIWKCWDMPSMMFSRAQCRLAANKKISSGKKNSHENCTILIYFVERNPLRSISVIFVGRIFFGTHCRVLPVWVVDSIPACHAWRLGHFKRDITLNNEYLSQFLPDRKVLWMTLEQLFKSFVKLPIFDSSRAICALLRGQNQLLVPSGWGKVRKPWKFA